jgi:hypothetical protein
MVNEYCIKCQKTHELNVDCRCMCHLNYKIFRQ